VKCRMPIRGVCKRFGKCSRAVRRDSIGAHERSPEHGAIDVYRRLADKIAMSVEDDGPNSSYVRWSTGRVDGARGGEPISPVQRCDRALMLVVIRPDGSGPRGKYRNRQQQDSSVHRLLLFLIGAVCAPRTAGEQ